MRVHVLRLHAGYRCRHAGVCCTEDWAIPVEASLYRRLAQALASSALQPEHVGARYFEPAQRRQADEPVVTGRVGRDCAFFEPGRGRLCAIHGQLGHDHLPSACQHFPRVVTIDAREALPPQVSRDVLWDWDALTAWECGILGLLEQRSPERALSAVAHAAGRLEHGRPGGDSTLARAAASALDTARREPGRHRVDIDALDALARQAATDAISMHAAPSDRAVADRDLVAPAWEGLSPLIGRYLAARTVAAAVGHHAASVRAWAASLDTAYAVLRTEAARQASRADRALDADLLTAAAADADRLLVHRIDAASLARGLDGVPYQRL